MKIHTGKIRTGIFLVTLFGLFALTGGCATTSNPPEDSTDASAQSGQRHERDPFERFNRVILKSNLTTDRFLLKPAAKVYAKLPSPVRNGVGNFFSNLGLPYTILNDLLQGKFDHAGRDTGRFAINTILGLFGLMDVATELDLPHHREDFGQTLAVWGVPSGPYLVLPLFGPSSLRDSTNLIPQWVYTDEVLDLDSPEDTYTTVVRILDTRASLLGLDDVLELQPDKYLFLRESYWQQRNQLIYEGNPPDDIDGVSEEQLLDELLD